MKKIGKNVIIAIVLIVVVSLMVMKLLANKKAVADKVYKKDPDTRVSVTLDTVATRPLKVVKQYLGSFEANREVTISAETQGHIITDNVKEGDMVHPGELIARVDNDGLKAQRFSAQASFNNAQANLVRYQNASVGEGVSQMQVDEQKLNLKSAQAQLEEIDKQVAQSRIEAPFAGNVTSKYFELGTYVSPGAKLVDIADLSEVKLDINVPEAEVGFFTKGKLIHVTTDVYPDISFTGTVNEIVAKADNNHNYPLKITIKNSPVHKLLAGMYGSVTKNDELNQAALTIIRTALLGSAENPQVFVVKQGVARLVNIQTGRSNDKLIEVTRGLQQGDLVVSSGQVNLTDGTKVIAGN
jgi:RND family efflux transporter MFP subunit